MIHYENMLKMMIYFKIMLRKIAKNEHNEMLVC